MRGIEEALSLVDGLLPKSRLGNRPSMADPSVLLKMRRISPYPRTFLLTPQRVLCYSEAFNKKIRRLLALNRKFLLCYQGTGIGD